MIVSKLTSKARTTIPQPIRAALHLKDGDAIAYQIDGETVVMTRASAEAIERPFATFSVWASEAERRAYANL